MLIIRRNHPSRRFAWALLSCAAWGWVSIQPSLAEGAPAAIQPYALTIFAKPPEGLSKPDSLAIVNGTIWIGYGNTGKKDGADGAVSQIVEYTMDGTILKTLKIRGHNDGVTVDPSTGKVWAIQNEDGNPTLIVIDPKTDAMVDYVLPPAGHGGGYDDVVFKNGEAFVTASAPETDGGKTNPGPSLVRLSLGANGKSSVEPAFPGAPKIANAVDGKVETLNLTDPDSITMAPNGEMVMTSQDDSELILIEQASATAPKGQVLHLVDDVKVDDTTFVSGPKGFLLVSDTAAGVVWKITAPDWTAGDAFSAMSGVDATKTAKAKPGYVGALDMKTGVLKPVVSNMDSPHGLIFVPAP